MKKRAGTGGAILELLEDLGVRAGYVLSTRAGTARAALPTLRNRIDPATATQQQVLSPRQVKPRPFIRTRR